MPLHAISPSGDHNPTTSERRYEMQPQQVHIISNSDDDVEDMDAANIEVLSVLSDSGNSVQSDFAGFSPLPDIPEVEESCGDYAPHQSVEILYHMADGKNGRNELNSSYEAVPAIDTGTTFNFQSSIDQIVEVTSNTTTKSQQEKRHQIQIGYDAAHRKANNSAGINNNNNKCSTETSSEFPVSSPSNPQATAGRYKRPPLLKNTLPADAFERSLALITVRNPQMSLEEKMAAWHCDTDLSDVEDVHDFDNRFKEYEVDKFQTQKIAQSYTKSLEKPSTSSAAVAAATAAHIYTAYQRRLKSTLSGSKERDDEHARYVNAKPSAQQMNQTTRLIYERANVHKDLVSNASKTRSLEARRNAKEDCYKLFCLYRNELDKSSVDSGGVIGGGGGGGAAGSGGNGDNGSLACDAQDSLIQMHFDFSKEKQELHLKEKTRELFKTPNIPQKYLLLPKRRYNNSNEAFEKTTATATTKTSLSPTTVADMEDESTYSGPLSAHFNVPPSTHMDDTQSFESKEHLGAYHQQHEFCNYLGLTGMSTANAVANAVAELARCNPARRSLRVQRLQQQEKKKERPKAMKASSPTPQRRERGGLDDGGQETDINSGDEASTLPNYNPSPPPPPPARPVSDERAQSEIKILCQISADNSASQTDMARRNCVKQLIAPLRRSLLQQLRPQINTRSNGTSTCPRSSQHSGGSDDDDERGGDGDEESIDVSSPSPATIATPQTKRIENASKANAPSLPQPRPLDIECRQRVHDKFQRYLEASREAKPSIFIVKCLNNVQAPPNSYNSVAANSADAIAGSAGTRNMKTSIVNNNNNKMLTKRKTSSTPKSAPKSLPTPPQTPKSMTPPQRETREEATPKAAKAPSKMMLNLKTLNKHVTTTKRLNKGGGNTFVPSTVRPFPLHRLLTRSAFNLSAQHQLRSRKIFIVKPTRMPLKVKSKTAEMAHKTLERRAKPSSPSKRTADEDTDAKSFTPNKRRRMSMPMQAKPNGNIAPTLADNEAVVVSSTTNSCYDERMLKWNNSQMPTHRETLTQDAIALLNVPVSAAGVKEIYHNSSFDVNQYSHTQNVITTRDNSTQCSSPCLSPITTLMPPPSTQPQIPLATTTTVPNGLRFLNTSHTTSEQQNPLKAAHGQVLYIYYELDVLIVVQEAVISFWKCSKLLQLLSLVANNASDERSSAAVKATANNWSFISPKHKDAPPALTEWLHLGECAHLTSDIEVQTPYANRICMHNSMPIYVELRCRELPHERRDCNLLSLYINVYYFNDEEMVAKMHSVALDSVQSLPANLTYTTIPESRYFVVSWPQENILGKLRSGMCKYSLTPQLDTLASIREFKNMRFKINYLECIKDDKLLGFGETQLTIWDHRSGDVLMCYDLGIALGRNLGCHYFPSLEIGQNNVLLLFQYVMQSEQSERAELLLIACSISHVTPTHRVLQRQPLPSAVFNNIKTAINTGEQLIITATNDEELWLNCNNPSLWTCVAPQNTQRFYANGGSQLVEVTPTTLCVDSFANHVLKLVANAYFRERATTAL